MATMIDKVLSLIDDRGMSQAELESRAGLARNRIAVLKGSGKARADEAFRIARVLGVTADYLLDEGASEIQRDVSDEESKVLWLAGQIGYDEAVRRLMLTPEITSAAPSYSETKKKPPPGSARNRDGGKGGA